MGYDKRIDIALETYIFNGQDVTYRVDEFMTKAINVLYITGLSGSGKSTLAKEMSEKLPDVIVFELDRIEHYKDFIDRKPYTLCEELLQRHFKETGETRSTGEMNDSEYNRFFLQAFYYLLDYVEKHGDKRFIFEGVQVCSQLHDERCIWDGAIIVKGTSALSSSKRRMKRDGGFIMGGRERNAFDRARYYMNAERWMNVFRGEVKKRNKARG